MTTIEVTTITAADVAAMLASDYDDVAVEICQAVLIAIIDRGDEPDSDLVASLPVTVRAWDGGSSESTTVDYGDEYEEVAQELWEDADYGDGDYRVTVRWTVTDADGTEIDSGDFELVGTTEEPECPVADEHDWTSEYEGGCSENPGVWATGGTSMLCVAHCRICGMSREQTTTGVQRNPGECDTTTYGNPDPDWVAERDR